MSEATRRDVAASDAAQPAQGDDDVRPLRRGLRRFRRGFRGFQARARRTRAGALTLRIAVTLFGSLVILAGIVMLIGPGQGILAIILGLAILATEYEWAERWMHRLRVRVEEATRKAREMDPKVRRRRLLIGALVVLAMTGVCCWYVLTYGWPVWSLDGWAAMRSFLPFLPPLPQP